MDARNFIKYEDRRWNSDLHEAVSNNPGCYLGEVESKSELSTWNMTSQCAQTRLSTNFSFLVTPKVLASCQKLTRTGLQNGTISLRGRCSRHCESDVSWEPRHLNSRIACMRAGEPSIPKPTWVEMTAITREDQFDEALESGNPIIIDWCSLSPPSACTH